MNGKELTDKEIVSALENTKITLDELAEYERKLADGELDIASYARSWEEGDNRTVTCDLLNAMEQAVAVFNKQKSDIEVLKTELQKESQEHLVFAELAKKAYEQRKEEIERLTEERNKYKGLYETMYRKWSDLQDKEFNCEALRKEKNEYFDKAVELQKQVDEYKDKIEQGTLIELPCKVGDIVYGLSCYRVFGCLSGKIFKGKVIAFYIERGLYLRIEAEHDNGNFYLEYGKEVFLTCEETEKRLQEIQG